MAYGYIIAAAIAAVSSLASASATRNASIYQQKVDLQNADASQQAAAQDAIRLRQQQYQQLGRMRANFAASGLDPTTGSAEDVLADTTTQQAWDYLNTKAGGAMKARAFGIDANLDNMRANSAETSGVLSAASSLAYGSAASYDAYSRLGSGATPKRTG